MSLPSLATPESSTLGAFALRERLLTRLLKNPSALLIRRDDSLARVRLLIGVEIAILTCGDAASELLPRVEALTQDMKKGVLHLVVVGGGADVVSTLQKGAQSIFGRRFGFHHLDDSGKLAQVKGDAWPPLKQATVDLATATPLSEDELASRLAQGRQELRFTTALRGRFPWVTATIAAICALVFGLASYWDGGSHRLVLSRMGADNGTLVRAGEVWRLLASAFLHLNTGHLVVNMLALSSFGVILERLLGARRYLMLYALSALGGALASAFLRGPGFAVGASGAIWGLMTAGVGLALRPRGLLPPATLARLRRQVAVPLGINLLYSFSPGIDLFAHFGGGLVGLALMASGALTLGVEPVWADDATEAPGPKKRSATLTLGAAALALAMLASLATALVMGRPWELRERPVLKRVEVADTGMSVELPTVLSGTPVVEVHDGVRTFSYGTLATDPVVVQISVNVLPAPVAADELDAAMEVEQKAMQEATPPPGAVREGDARIVMVNDRPFALVTHRMNAIPIRSWASIFGDREVYVRISSAPDLPSAWAGVDDRVVASLNAR